jgi:hypothetical protein
MQSRNPLLALSILALAAFAADPARAGTAFTTSRFQITFPDGWQALTAPGTGDTVLAVFSQTTFAFSWMSVSTFDHQPTAQEIEAYRQAYSGSDSVTKVADGTKTLGGKSFTYIEYEVVDSTDGTSRARFYYTQGGMSLFTSFLTYDPAVGSASVAQLETALGTLNLTGAPIRPLPARAYPALRAADRDILGRARALQAPARLYRLPAY